MTGLDPYSSPEESFDPWNFRTEVAVEVSGAKLTGYRVEAVDGGIGKVTDFRLDPDNSYLVLSTGKLFGRKVILPAGIVNHIDHTERRIYLDRDRDQIKQAPQWDAREQDRNRRGELAGYYARTLRTSR